MAAKAGYVPKLTHEERRERRKKIASEIASYPLAERTSDLLAKIAEKYSVNRSSVREYCQRFKVKLPPAKTRAMQSVQSSTLEIVAALIEQKSTGLSYTEIGEKHGLTKQRVEQVKKQAEKAGVFKAVKRAGA